MMLERSLEAFQNYQNERLLGTFSKSSNQLYTSNNKYNLFYLYLKLNENL